MRATDNSLAFVTAVGIKSGGWMWLCLVVSRVLYLLLLGSRNARTLFGIWWPDLLGYAAFSLVFCAFVGFLSGLFRLREYDQPSAGSGTAPERQRPKK